MPEEVLQQINQILTLSCLKSFIAWKINLKSFSFYREPFICAHSSCSVDGLLYPKLLCGILWSISERIISFIMTSVTTREKIHFLSIIIQVQTLKWSAHHNLSIELIILFVSRTEPYNAGTNWTNLMYHTSLGKVTWEQLLSLY